MLPDDQQHTGNVQDRTGQHFLYDSEREIFIPVERTTQAVDTLLAVSGEMMNRDSQISFHSAREALMLADEIGYLDGKARALNMVANKYLDFGDYELALNHYLRAIKLEEELGNRERVAALLNNMALVHLEQASYDKSAEYLLQSIELKNELGLNHDTYLAMNNLGVAYRRQSEYSKALGYFREAQHLSLDMAQDTLVHMVATLNIGNTLRNLGELDEAIGYLMKAENYFREQDYQLHLIVTNLFKGLLYLDRNQYDEALRFAAVSLEMAEAARQRERIKDAHKLIAEIHERQGNYREAFLHFRYYHEISDTLYNLQRSSLINEMQGRFDVEQKNREIDLLNKEFALQEAKLSRQDLVRQSLIVGVFLLLIIAGQLLYTNHQRKRNNQLLRDKGKEIEQKNSKLEELNKEKDEFLGIVAHDLRNPLSVIKTAVELINDETPPTAEEIEEYSNLIHISSDRMLDLVNNLLDIQCMNAGKNRTRVEKIEVNSSVEQSVKHFQRSAETKNIKLTTKLAENCTSILGDSNSLTRILDNLVSNAIKYSPFDSEVKISTSRSDQKVRISVEDKGPGIADEEMEKLFGRYSKLSNKPTGNEKSTGLGLYIVKKLTRSMNGEAGCESKPGEGSTFFVEFPVLERDEEITDEASGKSIAAQPA
jgi:signal transduction histidine kinase